MPRHTLPTVALPAGSKTLTSAWTVRWPGWDAALLLRLGSYQLTAGKLIRVLPSRPDLCALSLAQLEKERWTIAHWGPWWKRVYQVKEPLGRRANALPRQSVAAFVTALLLRACKQAGA